MRRHLTYANVISSICLFILLGGSAYAAVSITGKQVKNNSLTSADIRNGTLRSADFGRGVIPAATSHGPGAPGQPGPQGPQGEKGEKGDRGEDGPGAVPIALTLDEGDFQVEHIDVGAWTVGFSCSDREGRPQVQLWGYTDEGATGTLQWVGIRTHSAEGSFITEGATDIDTALRGLESRWAPEGGWAGVGLELQFRSGSRAGSVSLHMTADDRGSGPGKCTVAGTAVAAA